MVCRPFLLLVLLVFKGKTDTHVLDEFVCRMYFHRLVFLCCVAVEADGELDARALDDVLLRFVLEELRHVGVLTETVYAVVVDVHFPKDACFRHFTEVAVGLFAARSNELEHIRMRHADGTAATLCKVEQVAVGDRSRIVKIFNQGKIEKGNIRAHRQGVTVFTVQRTNLDAAKDFDALCVLVAKQIHVVVVACKRLAVVCVKASAFAPTEFFARATDAVIVVANPKLLYAAGDCRFNHRFGLVVRTE